MSRPPSRGSCGAQSVYDVSLPSAHTKSPFLSLSWFMPIHSVPVKPMLVACNSEVTTSRRQHRSDDNIEATTSEATTSRRQNRGDNIQVVGLAPSLLTRSMTKSCSSVDVSVATLPPSAKHAACASCHVYCVSPALRLTRKQTPLNRFQPFSVSHSCAPAAQHVACRHRTCYARPHSGNASWV